MSGREEPTGTIAISPSGDCFPEGAGKRFGSMIKTKSEVISSLALRYMMNKERLTQLERSINRLWEQIASKENTLVTIAPEEKIRIKQQIEDLRLELRQFEQEYWLLLSNSSASLEFPEEEAETAVSEAIVQVEQIQISQPDVYSREIFELLSDIKAKLDNSGVPASAKLRGMISSIPPFIGISYEAELDTETFLRKNFPTFRRLISIAAKKS